MDPYCLWMIISFALACFLVAWSASPWALLCGMLATGAVWTAFALDWLLVDGRIMLCLGA